MTQSRAVSRTPRRAAVQRGPVKAPAIRPASPVRIPDRTIQQQLGRILASKTFQPVARLRRFLQFIVSETVAGRGDKLKEYVVGVHVFEKEASFDPRTDPIVRVQARRVRARLVRYYREEGQTDEIVIELPKGRYAPTFTRSAGDATPRAAGMSISSRNTVTVVPFADHSRSGDLDYFCQAATRQLIHGLSQIPTVKVIAGAPGAPALGDAPGAPVQTDAAVTVAGGVRHALDDTGLVVTTQLFDTVTGACLASEITDVAFDKSRDPVDVVAGPLIERIQSALLAERSDRRPRHTENLTAHNLYLQGKYHLGQRTEEGLLKAADLFQKAIGEDPHYAMAHSGLADTYELLSHYGVLPPAQGWVRAASSAATAVMLDGDSAEAHTSLAHVKATQDWDWSGAEREYQRAIALNPRYPTTHHWYGMTCLVPMGRLDEALQELVLAQSLDPVSSIIARDLAVVHCYRREFDAALEQCDHTIALNPHFSPAYLTLGLVQEQRKEYDEAAAAFERAVHLSPLSHRMSAALARTLALSGKRQKALKIVKSLETLSKTRYVSPFDFASIHFGLGALDHGFRWLNRACEDRCFELLALGADPRFDALRNDRRLLAIVKRVGLH
jgi:serine/threonine-protein kinase